MARQRFYSQNIEISGKEWALKRLPLKKEVNHRRILSCRDILDGLEEKALRREPCRIETKISLLSLKRKECLKNVGKCYIQYKNNGK